EGLGGRGVGRRTESASDSRHVRGSGTMSLRVPVSDQCTRRGDRPSPSTPLRELRRTLPTRATAKHHPHDDAPDTADAFRRLAALPEGPERDALRDEIVEAWLPMADRLAGRFRSRGENFDDLRQVAALGLVKAVDRYEPGLGNAFESYAVPTITGEIKRHFRDRMWTLHVPRRVQELRNRVRYASQDLSQTIPGRRPTVAEIAESAHLSEEDVRTGQDALDSFSELSYDAA